jgi:hypothetical protein
VIPVTPLSTTLIPESPVQTTTTPTTILGVKSTTPHLLPQKIHMTYLYLHAPPSPPVVPLPLQLPSTPLTATP